MRLALKIPGVLSDCLEVPRRAEQFENSRPLRVLVVEDNPVNMHVAVRLLKKQGHSTESATNGKAALTALEKERFDLVLMDVQMPELDGMETTRRIRQHEVETGTHTPIIAMTAHAMQGDRELCLAAGMDAYVSKPIVFSELWAAIVGVSSNF